MELSGIWQTILSLGELKWSHQTPYLHFTKLTKTYMGLLKNITTVEMTWETLPEFCLRVLKRWQMMHGKYKVSRPMSFPFISDYPIIYSCGLPAFSRSTRIGSHPKRAGRFIQAKQLNICHDLNQILTFASIYFFCLVFEKLWRTLSYVETKQLAHWTPG